jgi:hypothetical protein
MLSLFMRLDNENVSHFTISVSLFHITVANTEAFFTTSGILDLSLRTAAAVYVDNLNFW